MASSPSPSSSSSPPFPSNNPSHRFPTPSSSNPSSPSSLPLSRTPPSNIPTGSMMAQLMLVEEQGERRERINTILNDASFQDPGWGDRDLELVLVSGDGSFQVPMNVHRGVLVDSSGFFKEKLMSHQDETLTVNIQNSDVLEICVEVVVLMYCKDLKKKFVGGGVYKVLCLLKIAIDLKFEAGVSSCLQFLEATPWTEKEEEQVFSQLRELGGRAEIAEVLERLTSKPPISSGANDVFLQVMDGVLQAKNDKAREEMKSLISELLEEEPTCPINQDSKIDVSAEVLKQLCQNCLTALIDSSKRLTSKDADAGAFQSEISRQANNLLWVVEILIEKDLGDEFVKQWGDQKELARLHPQIPKAHRFEMSRITAHLCNSMAKGLILVPRDARYSLLSTWLEALYDDFLWMTIFCKNFDRKLVEKAISQMILTLSLVQQQGMVLDWLKHFVNKGGHCPNLQQAFDVWWRRAFLSKK